MAIILPALPYDGNALEPYISARIIEFHYGKHHQAYVNNLNGLLPGTVFEHLSLEEIVKKAEGGIFNNAAQVWNHTFYWEGFSSNRGTKPSGDLLKVIHESFETFENFKTEFTKTAATLFGSGWAWLVEKEDGMLEITHESNAGNPMRKGLRPLLTCDVWEHAYYLDYQNRRPDYIAAFWNLVDWDIIGHRYMS
jgi:superoxide dismutase, Fe-Mn family